MFHRLLLQASLSLWSSSLVGGFTAEHTGQVHAPIKTLHVQACDFEISLMYLSHFSTKQPTHSEFQCYTQHYFVQCSHA